MAAFLGVETSLTGRRWIGPSAEVARHAEALSQQTGLSLTLCQVLARQGVDAAGAEAYLAPQLRDLLPDPRSLRDMESAARRLTAAVTDDQRIAIFADYDVDGGSSAALLIWWLRFFGKTATLYVPDRIDEGYGPNPEAIGMLAEGHDLILCVDCGTLSHDALAAARGQADVIVLDHHLGGETLPDVLAVVNPNRLDETGESGHLCAAGVVFLALVDANRQLREAGRKGPDLLSMLDLVALATVADVAPLRGVNRAFVSQGLRVMARRARPGLVALADVGRVQSTLEAYHLGYVLGPRINAGGRIGQADLGARLLATESAAEAGAMAERLDQLNADRRAVEADVQAVALEQAEARGFDAPLVWASGEGWHPGVVGIVAARLKERTNRPAIVIGFDGDEGKGSGRSVTGIDLGTAIQRLAREGVLRKGGGHAMAAGLTVGRDQLEPAMARLSDLLARQGAGALGAADLRVDGLLMPEAATVERIEDLDRAGPYGAGAPGPRFVFPEQKIRFAKRVGDTHLKLSFGAAGGQVIDAIAFGAFDSALGPALEQGGPGLFHLAGRLEINDWGGRRRVQLRLEDAAIA